MTILLCAIAAIGLISFIASLEIQRRYENAKSRLEARLCPHGIVDTGWCEECQEKFNAPSSRNICD
jgi:hypothetical protein